VVPVGGSCLRDTDCMDGLCQRGKSDETGSCAVPATEGGDCAAPARCELGLRCDVTVATCVRPVGEGKPCQSPFECEAGLSCTAEARCEPSRAGSPCVTGIVPCSPGQSCVFDECVVSEFAEGDCKNPSTECEGTERCVVQQLDSFQQIAACEETVRFGAGCDASSPCVEPLSCRGGRCAP